MDHAHTCESCKCPHHMVLPVLVFLFGATFLLGMWGVISPAFVNWAWPTYITLAGAMMIVGKKCSCCCGK